MSLCDRCFAPGACCKAFVLTGGDFGQSFAWASTMLAIAEDSGLPFRPLDAVGYPNLADGWYWRWSCPNLLQSGRCGDYDNRPGLCRRYRPMEEGLCVHWNGFEAGDASAGEITPGRLGPDIVAAEAPWQDETGTCVSSA